MDNEIWKDIPEFEGRYKVSNLGRVMGIHRMLNPTKTKAGYLRVCLLQMGKKKKQLFVHRAVAEAFIGHIDDEHEVNHIDGNKQNNRLDNLEIVTREENIFHAHHILKKNNLHKKYVTVYCYELDKKCKSINEMARFLFDKNLIQSRSAFQVKCSRYIKAKRQDLMYCNLHFSLIYDMQ